MVVISLTEEALLSRHDRFHDCEWIQSLYISLH